MLDDDDAEEEQRASRTERVPRWSLALPALAAVALALTWGKSDLPELVLAVLAPLLVGSVLAAVVHAETIAHRVGEPFGRLDDETMLTLNRSLVLFLGLA